MKPQRGSRGVPLLCPKLAARKGVGGQQHSATTSPLVRALVPIGTDRWAPGPVWIEKILTPPPGMETRTPQPLAHLYIDYAFPAAW
jgi:hypothetical protein